jgi:hypothetical protein
MQAMGEERRAMTARSFTWGAVALTLLAAFTAWITWRAEALEIHVGHVTMRAGLPGPSVRLPSSSCELRGKTRLVFGFWASCCGPCREEVPALALIYRTTDLRGLTSYELLTFSIDTERSGEQMAAQMKRPFTVLLDFTAATVRPCRLRGIPAVFVIDAMGTVRYGRVGYETGPVVILGWKGAGQGPLPWAAPSLSGSPTGRHPLPSYHPPYQSV